jgi:hypothetical protein
MNQAATLITVTIGSCIGGPMECNGEFIIVSAFLITLALLLNLLHFASIFFTDWPNNKLVTGSCIHQEKSKCTLCHLVTSVDLIKLNKVDSEGDLLNLSQNVLKIAYLKPQGALSLIKYVVKAPNRGNLLNLPDSVAVYNQFISILR